MPPVRPGGGLVVFKTWPVHGEDMEERMRKNRHSESVLPEFHEVREQLAKKRVVFPVVCEILNFRRDIQLLLSHKE